MVKVVNVSQTEKNRYNNNQNTPGHRTLEYFFREREMEKRVHTGSTVGAVTDWEEQCMVHIRFPVGGVPRAWRGSSSLASMSE